MDIDPRPHLNEYSRSLLVRKVVVKATGQAGVLRTVHPDPQGAPFSVVVTFKEQPYAEVCSLDEIEFPDEA